MNTADPLRPTTTKDDKGTHHALNRDVIAAAFIEWTRPAGPLGYSSLGYDIDRILGGVWEGKWNFGRAADTIVQRLSKAGWIEKADKRRGWRLTDLGNAERLKLKAEIQAAKTSA
jgi:hypothetical protein